MEEEAAAAAAAASGNMGSPFDTSRRASWGDSLTASMRGLYSFLQLRPHGSYSQKEREFLNSLYEADGEKFEALTSPPSSPPASPSLARLTSGGRGLANRRKGEISVRTSSSRTPSPRCSGGNNSGGKSSPRPSSPLNMLSGLFGKRPRSAPASPQGEEEGQGRVPAPSPCSNSNRRGRSGRFQKGSSPGSPRCHESDPQPYLDQLNLAAGHDLTAIAASGALKVAGRDSEGRIVVMVTPQACMPSVEDAQCERGREEDGNLSADADVPSQGSDDPSLALARLLLYFITLLDQVVTEPYVVVYCNTQMTWLSWGRFSFLAQLHGLLPQRFKQNIKKLIVVHPTPVLRMFFVFGRLFLTPQFYTKLYYVDHVMALTDYLPRDVIKELPDLVFLYDIPAFDRFSHLDKLTVVMPDTCAEQEVRTHERQPARISGRTWANASERGGASRFSAVRAGRHRVLSKQGGGNAEGVKFRGRGQLAGVAQEDSDTEDLPEQRSDRAAVAATGRRSMWQGKWDMKAALEVHRKTLTHGAPFLTHPPSGGDPLSQRASHGDPGGMGQFRDGGAGDRVMGGSLVQLAGRFGSANGAEQVPWLVERCVTYLSSRGRLENVGLFRLAGDGYEFQRLRAAVELGPDAICWEDQDQDEVYSERNEEGALFIHDHNTIAQLLKAYFRELPDPLIPFESYAQVIAIARAAQECNASWIQAIKTILWSVPSAHYSTLKYLFAFLGRVASASACNRMTCENLAIVWAPNLIRPRDTDPFITLRDLKFVTDSTMWLIEHHSEILTDD